MEAIRTWLNGSRDYDTGVILYDSFGHNDAVKRMLAQGHSPYRQQELVKHLRDLLKKAPTITVPVTEAAPVAVAVAMPDMPEYKGKREADPYLDKWQPLFIKMNALRHRLLLAPNDTIRGEMAFEILDLERQCMYWWDRRDYFFEYGHEMPEDKKASGPAPTVDVTKQQKRLTTVRTYVSRYERKCDEKGIAYKDHEKLQQYYDEREQLEKDLGYERTPR